MTADEILDLFRARRPWPPLSPTSVWDRKLTREIRSAGLCRELEAVLHLLNDDLDRAHRIAQDIPTEDGSLIHAVMHRRETEYRNSKYWLRRAGAHPVVVAMKEEFEGYDPSSFVDRCERGDSRAELERIQARELELLAEHCGGL